MKFALSLPASVRRLLRGWHRDAGYLAVGLTLVYALSGLAVNHIADWDPNFTQVNQTLTLPPDTPKRVDPSDAEDVSRLGANLARRLDLRSPLKESYAISDTELELTLESGSVRVDLERGQASLDAQKPRFLLRIANWLHTNRGKKAWTYVADLYAVLLLYLAGSGLVLLPIKGGLADRKLWLVLTGALVPVVYVAWSGGP